MRIPRPLRVDPRITAVLAVLLLALSVPALAVAAGNGKLQVHHIDCGQGDAALLISPLGETALFDDGTSGNCAAVIAYLQGQGLASVQYHFATHYHSDHVGCMDDLAAVGITVSAYGYDRGGSYTTQDYTKYVTTLGSKRSTLTKGQSIVMDAGSGNPVTITVVDLNGAGVYSGTDENALSTVYKITYGAFHEVIGGDLSAGSGMDIESVVGPEVGAVEVFKVHHHGSRTSNSDNWLNATTPSIGVISVGSSNSYGHPTADALTRLHNHNVRTYWTETGAGVAPNASWDKVGGTIRIEAMPGSADSFTVYGTGFADKYPNGASAPPPPPTLSDSVVATTATFTRGTLTGGSAASLAANDASYMVVTSAKVGSTYGTDWYGQATLAHPPTSLKLTYDGKYSVSRTQTLYLWNWTTSAWTQVNSSTVSTSDVTRTYTTTSPAAYVSPTLQVRARVLANTRSSSYTCSGDLMRFTYQYQQGTAPVPVVAELPPVTGDEPPADEVRPLAGGAGMAAEASRPAVLEFGAAPNPARESARFRFSLSRAEAVRLEIFDLAGRRVAVPFDGTAQPGGSSVAWTLRNTDGSRVAPGIYFARLLSREGSLVTKLVVTGR